MSERDRLQEPSRSSWETESNWNTGSSWDTGNNWNPGSSWDKGGKSRQIGYNTGWALDMTEQFENNRRGVLDRRQWPESNRRGALDRQQWPESNRRGALDRQHWSECKRSCALDRHLWSECKRSSALDRQQGSECNSSALDNAKWSKKSTNMMHSRDRWVQEYKSMQSWDEWSQNNTNNIQECNYWSKNSKLMHNWYQSPQKRIKNTRVWDNSSQKDRSTPRSINWIENRRQIIEDSDRWSQNSTNIVEGGNGCSENKARTTQDSDQWTACAVSYRDRTWWPENINRHRSNIAQHSDNNSKKNRGLNSSDKRIKKVQVSPNTGNRDVTIEVFYSVGQHAKDKMSVQDREGKMQHSKQERNKRDRENLSGYRTCHSEHKDKRDRSQLEDRGKRVRMYHSEDRDWKDSGKAEDWSKRDEVPVYHSEVKNKIDRVHLSEYRHKGDRAQAEDRKRRDRNLRKKNGRKRSITQLKDINKKDKLHHSDNRNQNNKRVRIQYSEDEDNNAKRKNALPVYTKHHNNNNQRQSIQHAKIIKTNARIQHSKGTSNKSQPQYCGRCHIDNCNWQHLGKKTVKDRLQFPGDFSNNQSMTENRKKTNEQKYRDCLKAKKEREKAEQKAKEIKKEREKAGDKSSVSRKYEAREKVERGKDKAERGKNEASKEKWKDEVRNERENAEIWKIEASKEREKAEIGKDKAYRRKGRDNFTDGENLQRKKPEVELKEQYEDSKREHALSHKHEDEVRIVQQTEQIINKIEYYEYVKDILIPKESLIDITDCDRENKQAQDTWANQYYQLMAKSGGVNHLIYTTNYLPFFSESEICARVSSNRSTVQHDTFIDTEETDDLHVTVPSRKQLDFLRKSIIYPNFMLSIHNIPFSLKQSEVRLFFEQYQNMVEFDMPLYTDNKTHQGIAFATYCNKESYKNALSSSVEKLSRGGCVVRTEKLMPHFPHFRAQYPNHIPPVHPTWPKEPPLHTCNTALVSCTKERDPLISTIEVKAPSQVSEALDKYHKPNTEDPKVLAEYHETNTNYSRALAEYPNTNTQNIKPFTGHDEYQEINRQDFETYDGEYYETNKHNSGALSEFHETNIHDSGTFTGVDEYYETNGQDSGSFAVFDEYYETNTQDSEALAGYHKTNKQGPRALAGRHKTYTDNSRALAGYHKTYTKEYRAYGREIPISQSASRTLNWDKPISHQAFNRPVCDRLNMPTLSQYPAYNRPVCDRLNMPNSSQYPAYNRPVCDRFNIPNSSQYPAYNRPVCDRLNIPNSSQYPTCNRPVRDRFNIPNSSQYPAFKRPAWDRLNMPNSSQYPAFNRPVWARLNMPKLNAGFEGSAMQSHTYSQSYCKATRDMPESHSSFEMSAVQGQGYKQHETYQYSEMKIKITRQAIHYDYYTGRHISSNINSEAQYRKTRNINAKMDCRHFESLSNTKGTGNQASGVNVKTKNMKCQVRTKENVTSKTPETNVKTNPIKTNNVKCQVRKEEKVTPKLHKTYVQINNRKDQDKTTTKAHVTKDQETRGISVAGLVDVREQQTKPSSVMKIKLKRDNFLL